MPLAVAQPSFIPPLYSEKNTSYIPQVMHGKLISIERMKWTTILAQDNSVKVHEASFWSIELYPKLLPEDTLQRKI
jgi:hypothetical protein